MVFEKKDSMVNDWVSVDSNVIVLEINKGY